MKPKRIRTYSEIEENKCYYFTERIPYHGGGGVVKSEFRHEPIFVKEKRDSYIVVITISNPKTFMNRVETGKGPPEFVEMNLSLEALNIDVNFEPSKSERAIFIYIPETQEIQDQMLADFVKIRMVDKIKYRDPDFRKKSKATFGHFRVP